MFIRLLFGRKEERGSVHSFYESDEIGEFTYRRAKGHRVTVISLH